MPLARRARQEPGGNRRVMAASLVLVAAATSAALVGGLRAANADQVASSAKGTGASAPLAVSSCGAAGATTAGTSAAGTSAGSVAAPATSTGPSANPAARARHSAKPAAPARHSSKPAAPARAPKAPAAKRPTAGTGAKKGVGSAWSSVTLHALNDVGASWYYTWGVSSGLKPARARFVPMIWGPQQVTASDLATAKRSNSGNLLGFNEPDRPDQANLTPARACALWPRLQATGLRLGAPAVSWGADVPGGWLDQFMTCVRQHRLRVDFIPLHFYSSNYASATSDLKRYIAATYARYHKPVWITEYALLDFGAGRAQASPRQQAAFVRTSTAMMNRLSYLERYAWFALEYDQAKLGTGLYDAKGRPTLWGQEYRKAR